MLHPFFVAVRRWWVCGLVGTVSKQDISLCGKHLPSSGFVGCYKWGLTSPSFCRCTATGTRPPSADQEDALGCTNEKNSLFNIELDALLSIVWSHVYLIWDCMKFFLIYISSPMYLICKHTCGELCILC